jgi:hypothetical protein
MTKCSAGTRPPAVRYGQSDWGSLRSIKGAAFDTIERKMPETKATCVCCKKTMKEVGPFAALAEGVGICYPCLMLSKAIIEQECERLGIKPRLEHDYSEPG